MAHTGTRSVRSPRAARTIRSFFNLGRPSGSGVSERKWGNSGMSLSSGRGAGAAAEAAAAGFGSALIVAHAAAAPTAAPAAAATATPREEPSPNHADTDGLLMLACGAESARRAGLRVWFPSLTPWFPDGLCPRPPPAPPPPGAAVTACWLASRAPAPWPTPDPRCRPSWPFWWACSCWAWVQPCPWPSLCATCESSRARSSDLRARR
mmetsp:Transcript_23279/g.88201  ORF Transcript_23279/g.88201 Transcript_23279/m.88201 type:complete len:208 (+) Transcript_23279:1093-1716(+)